MPYKLISLVFLLFFFIISAVYSDDKFLFPVKKPSIFKKVDSQVDANVDKNLPKPKPIIQSKTTKKKVIEKNNVKNTPQIAVPKTKIKVKKSDFLYPKKKPVTYKVSIKNTKKSSMLNQKDFDKAKEVIKFIKAKKWNSANKIAEKVKDKDLGWVGEIESVDPKLLTTLINGGFVPVIATVAQDSKGNALNVNADTAAGAIAAALNAQKLVLMTDVAGVCTDKDDVDSLIRTVTFTKAEEMIASGIIAGGMIPKVTDCMNALRGGCVSGHIIDGRAPHSLLLEILTDEGCGTMITTDES